MLVVEEPGARLHLLTGEKLDVEQTVQDAARLLWGKQPGDDACDMGYAALARKRASGGPLLVNPAAVLYVEEQPSGRTASF